MRIRIATANVAGAARGEKAHPQKFELLGDTLKDHDIVGLQEVVRVTRGATVIRDDVAALIAMRSLSGYHHFFFPHLTSALHPHPGKWSSDVFRQYYEEGYEIQQGTAILSRHPFCHLLKDDLPGYGSAQILPWYNGGPTFYRGNRDTEPRSLLFCRVQVAAASVLFCCTQLTAVKEENTNNGRQPAHQGIETRTSQMNWIAHYLEDYQDVRKTFSETKDLVILVGDFNAEPGAAELTALDRIGLEVVPCRGVTHRSHGILIDLVFAPKAVPVKHAQIVDLLTLEADANLRISDHNPVLAELEVSES